MDSNEGQSSSNEEMPTSDAEVRLLGPQEIRTLAAELDITPTKKLGQNFVIDPNTVRRIVASAELAENDHVIEIGPGLGSLTLALLEQTGRAGSVTAVEIDGRLAARLPHTIAQCAPARASALTVVEQDALTLSAADLQAASLPAPTALVANLPYNVSVPVLLHLLHEFPSIRRVLVMVQLEVADRLAATPGSKIYGIPSVKAGFYGQVSKAGTIGKNVFWPAPKIDSGLVRIDRWNGADQPWHQALANRDSEEVRREVFAITDAAFLQRRKTLRAALSSYFGSGVAAEKVLMNAGIDPKQRGEKLGTGEFVDLAVAAIAAGSAEPAVVSEEAKN